MAIFMLTSPINRSEETAKIVGNQIWCNNIRKKRYLSHKEHPKDFNKEMRKRLVTQETERHIVKSFLDWEREVKPNTLAKPYLRKLEAIFERAINKNIKISLISFRHWDKDSKWNLSSKWREQAEYLWKELNEYLKNVKNEDTILASTHIITNMSVIKWLIHDNNFPNEWAEPLDFAETIKYIFYPGKDDSEPYLEIEYRDVKRKILYKDFKELFEN